MIEQELILLGLLKESPKHGYEIKMQVKRMLALFAGVNLKSIYYPLRILEKRGLVVKHASRSGKRPQRMVYELTAKGKSKFEKLLTKSLLDFTRPQFSLDLSLYFLHYLKPSIVKRRLRARNLLLENLSKDLQQMINSSNKNKSPSLTHILEHNLQMVKTESRFLSSFLKNLKP
ncbi:MAG: PadR family transcriptional regulator [Candidatus Omnitrophica bacterium]|nr:PadR family transcriptional regulator [Candidatus Omnitrophota bacterium]